MKISEKLAIIKRQEGELMRLYELREGIAKQSFKETAIRTEKDTPKEIEKKQREFRAGKKSKIADIDTQIRQLTKDIIEGKNTVNRKNVEIGIDKKLAEMKYLRIELSKLMRLVKSGRYIEAFDSDIFEELGLAAKIKEFEEHKQKLDNDIQKTNWSTEL
ncbi:MAG TPA: hypothetical protein VJJ72_00255 [Candidatus Paceibacterota bacterium]